jgi:ATP synthase protein I
MSGLGSVAAYAVLFSQIGFVFLVVVLAGVLAGYWLDGNLGTLPVFVLVGFLIGLTIGGLAVYRLIARFMARFD